MVIISLIPLSFLQDEDTLPSKPSCHSVGLGDTQPQGKTNCDLKPFPL